MAEKNKIITVKSKDELVLSELSKGEIHRVYIHIPGSSLGTPWRVPLIVARGIKKGPTLGITAALHGNELNGLSTIFKLFEKINPENLNGTVVAVPITNVPGYLRNQRYFSDGQDLNRLMPGKVKGHKPSEIYNFYLTQKIIRHFDYLLDLHTASSGRINSLYIRADLNDEQCKRLAMLQRPQIIVQKYDESGTLRAWANSQGIPSITIEIGNPNTFQHELIDDTLEGILNTMRGFGMIEGNIMDYSENVHICASSHWIYSQVGGILDVIPQLTQKISPGDVVARIYDVFGEMKSEVLADEEGVVIGKATTPACEAGSRILHLGLK